MKEKIKVTFDEMIEKIESLIKEGNLKRIIIKDENDELFMEVPLYVGIVASLAAPYATAIGAIAGYISKYSIEIITKEDSKTYAILQLPAHEEEQK